MAQPGTDTLTSSIGDFLDAYRAQRTGSPPVPPTTMTRRTTPRARSSRASESSSSSSSSDQSLFDVASKGSSATSVARLEVYPCERWGDVCDAWFAVGEEEAWFDHIADHLGGTFPAQSWCWFCDDDVFAAEGDDSHENREAAFHRRLMHIAHHLRTEDGLVIRPDFHVVEHLLQTGLGGAYLRDRAMDHQELPPPPGMQLYTPPSHPVNEPCVIIRGRGPTRSGGRKRRETHYHI